MHLISSLHHLLGDIEELGFGERHVSGEIDVTLERGAPELSRGSFQMHICAVYDISQH
jgi:hypothetical protein